MRAPTPMRAPTLALLVLSLVLCASAQNGLGRGRFSFAGSDPLASAQNGFGRGQSSSPFAGSGSLASAGQASEMAKQIQDRVNALTGARGFGGGGTFSSALGRLRSFSRGTRGEAERTLHGRMTGTGSGTGGTLLERVQGQMLPMVTRTRSSCSEAFDSVRSDLWWFAGPWANGGVFGNGFDPEFYSNDHSQLTLPIAQEPFVNPDTAGSGVPGQTYNFTGSEIRSQEVDYGFGCYSCAGIWDTPFEGVSVPHREIDIEFLVHDGKVKMQSNMFNDPDWSSGNQKTFEELHEVPSSGFHTYSFKWNRQYIQWFIDGVAVRKIKNSVDPIPQERQQTMRLMMNSYSADQNNPEAVTWAGSVPSGFAGDANIIKWFKFSKGSFCAPENNCHAVG